MQDQETYEFQFKITPVDIVTNPKLKTNLNKSVLFKLGCKEAKSKNIGESISLIVDVLYSKTLHKFCPLKGIIKIYDVNKDNSETIICVGAFNTEQLLSQPSKIVNIQRDIGPCKISLKVEVTNLKESKILLKSQKKQVLQLNQDLKKIIPSSKVFENKYLPQSQTVLNESLKINEGEKRSEPFILDDSCDCLEQENIRQSQLRKQHRLSEKQALGEQLIEQRRKNKLLEEKLQKNNIKLQLLKKTVTQKTNQIKSFHTNFRNFTAGLESDSRGQYILEINQKRKQISLRYKPNIRFKQVFEQFIAFMVRKVMQNNVVGTEKALEDEAEVGRIMKRMEEFELEKGSLTSENYSLKVELVKLKSELEARNNRIKELQKWQGQKASSISFLQQKLKRLIEQKRSFQGLNQYLQQRDTQMQNIINTKEITIENLKKIIKENNIEIDGLENRNGKLVKIIQNLQCQIQQMKEQNANLNQTIESYRLNYGDLKNSKDRALQRQFKECLRWIDQQNHDEDLNLQETTLEYSDPPSSMNSIIKNISQIENMPLQQIYTIRKQLLNVLKMVDEFASKNSISGSSIQGLSS